MHGSQMGLPAVELAFSDRPQAEPRFTLATKAAAQRREVH